MSETAQMSENVELGPHELSESERHRILVEWNNTRLDFPRDKCVHQLFEEQVCRTPVAMAAVFEDQELTYCELNARANQVAHWLRGMGVGPDSLVGICIERSLDMVVGLLGIWKGGGAYVPIDPRYPDDRVSIMVQDSGLTVLLTQQTLRQKFCGFRGKLLCIDSGVVVQEKSDNCAGKASADNLAYVIYTSGSTGKPKGVQICHRSLVNFLSSMRSHPGFTGQDTLLAVTTVSFDIAALELYLPLTVGGRVMLVGRETSMDGFKLRETIETAQPTVMQATPATWRLLVEAGWQGSKNLKVLCGGEAMPRDLAAELLKRASTVWNMYGPTETTVWSTVSQVTSGDGPITIGRPIGNTEIYILDSQLSPVPIGAIGDLYIGGDGVARGYLHRPDLTAERFIVNPFRDKGSATPLYKTGDLARYRPNGEIECLGRVDTQVKVRGFRIELGEIESVLAKYPGAEKNVVIARDEAGGDKRLVAYIAGSQAKSLSTEELREFLKQRLPDYMLPSQFVLLETLPLTPNGKVDRRALPAPEQLESTALTGHVAPRNSVESELVKIWESVLNIRNVGVKQDFFELGGHSLLVAKLLRRIEHTFDKKLSMAAIFEAPTIQQQASVLRNNSTLRWPSALAPIQPEGTRAPFFCFGLGAGPIFRSLAEHLGSDQPLIAVDPNLLDPSEVSAPYRMEEVVAGLAQQIRELQPEGPYYLGGICGGGLMAYATATHLIANAQQVGLVALFEPHTSYYAAFVEHSNGLGLSWIGKRAKFHIENMRPLDRKDTLAYIGDHFRERSRVFSDVLNGFVQKTVNDLRPRSDNGRERTIRQIMGPAWRDYRPQPLYAQVALFQATRRDPGGEWERQYWMDLASKLDVYDVPGYSNWIVRFFIEPNVGILASKLRSYLPGARTQGAQG
jgi:amino acid adenylation domain-containing protein